MSLLTGLTTERKLGGVVVLSGWLPLKEKFKAVGPPSSLIACQNIERLSIFGSAVDGIGSCEIVAHILGTWANRPFG